jgi:hypothetical protein
MSRVIRNVDVKWLDHEFNFHNKEFTSVTADRSDLVFACRQPFNESLYENIKVAGMRHPLIVLSNTLENHTEAVLGLSNAFPFTPLGKYLVVYGNQRLLCLDDLGKEYDIPIFIAGNHWEAVLIHNALNSSTEDR